MEGYRTQLVAAVMALLGLAAAFGFDVTPDQQKAILVFVNAVVWPAVMLIMRALTRRPMKIPFSGGKEVRPSTARTPWWVVAMLMLFWLGGCQTGDPVRDVLVESAARTGAFEAANLYIGNDPGRAAEVQRVSGILIAELDGNPEATVEALQALAEREIHWEQLDPIRQANVRQMIADAVTIMRAYEGDGILPDDYQLALHKLLVWFHTAASVVVMAADPS